MVRHPWVSAETVVPTPRSPRQTDVGRIAWSLPRLQDIYPTKKPRSLRSLNEPTRKSDDMDCKRYISSPMMTEVHDIAIVNPASLHFSGWEERNSSQKSFPEAAW